MKYLLAVSGGIDSVVLLHKLVQDGGHELIVAHFDHGIRPDSASDARFVEALAGQYGLPFVAKREELGSAAVQLASVRPVGVLGEDQALELSHILLNGVKASRFLDLYENPPAHACTGVDFVSSFGAGQCCSSGAIVRRAASSCSQ